LCYLVWVLPNLFDVEHDVIRRPVIGAGSLPHNKN
jgi:hypothetical protein